MDNKDSALLIGLAIGTACAIQLWPDASIPHTASTAAAAIFAKGIKAKEES